MIGLDPPPPSGGRPELSGGIPNVGSGAVSSVLEVGVGESAVRSTVIVLGCSAHIYAVLGSCGHSIVAQKGLVPTLIVESG